MSINCISCKGTTPIEPFLGEKKRKFWKSFKMLFCKNYWIYIVETYMVVIFGNGHITYELSRVQPQQNPFYTLKVKKSLKCYFFMSLKAMNFKISTRVCLMIFYNYYQKNWGSTPFYFLKPLFQKIWKPFFSKLMFKEVYL